MSIQSMHFVDSKWVVADQDCGNELIVTSSISTAGKQVVADRDSRNKYPSAYSTIDGNSDDTSKNDGSSKDS